MDGQDFAVLDDQQVAQVAMAALWLAVLARKEQIGAAAFDEAIDALPADHPAREFLKRRQSTV